MDDLVAFIRQQLNEDERVAQTCIVDADSHPTWRVADGAVWDAEGHLVISDALGEVIEAEHIARWDPARVLAEVEAKRRILALYADACDRVRNPVSAESRAAARAGQFELEQVITALAQPYAGQPGWRTEWGVSQQP